MTTYIEQPIPYAPVQGADVAVPEAAPIEASPEIAEPICFATDDPELVLQARQMVAQDYLRRNFVRQEDITDEGVIGPEADPYAEHSTYYVLMDPATNEMIATSRKIHYDPAKGEKSFPLFGHKEKLDPYYVRELEEIGLDKCVEISGLVKNPDLDKNGLSVLYLYRKLFQDAWNTDKKNKEQAFVMACSPKLYERFSFFFNGSMRKIGKELDYPGQPVIPVMFLTREGSVELIDMAGDPENTQADTHKTVVDLMLTGAEADTLDPALIEALKRNNLTETLDKLLPDGEASPDLIEKLKKHKPELIFGLGLMAYTAARTVGVAEGMSPYSDVDWKIFLGLELGTTPQYVYGMGQLGRSVFKPEQYSLSRRLRAAALAGSALVAPYAYVGIEGGGTPKAVWGGVLAAAALSISSAFAKLRSSYKNRQNNLAEAQATEITQ